MKFRVLYTSDHLPEEARNVLTHAHGGFAVDHRPDRGETYFALPGAGILRISGDLKSVKLLPTPDEVKAANLHSTAIWYALLLGFAHVRSLGTGMLVLACAGFVQNVALISMALALLAAAGERFRSRVMGVRTLAVYGLPLGLMASGALIERVGYPLAISLASAIGLVFTVLIGVRWRDSLWREPRPATTPA